MTDRRQHWENIYGTKAPDQVSWFRPHLETSLSLIERAAPEKTARIIDVGGGESTLVDDLLARGYVNLTVLDISQTAIDVTKVRLGALADRVEWVVADVTMAQLPPGYDIWHDRAVFHFLTSAADRAAYVKTVGRSVKPGGHVIVGTFGPEGPDKCSGLHVMRYDVDSLHGEFGPSFRLVESSKELHETPFGNTQQFLYLLLPSGIRDCLAPSELTASSRFMSDDTPPPILNHPIEQPSAFTAAQLIADVRLARGVPVGIVPPVCILEFDGDLTDWLVQERIAKPFPAWACFHTSMFLMELEGVSCGIIARTIGGPYAVLIAEQLHAAGVKLIVGLTSAGRLDPDLPLPSLVVATSAIRDEGTSYHYLPPGREVQCPTQVVPLLERELASTGRTVRSGKVWTTDAPYRETKDQLEKWASEGALAVEMQSASLFAFGSARQASVACVAMVSNAVDHQGEQFDTGSQDDGLRLLEAIARAARTFLETA